MSLQEVKRALTLDANVFVCALKSDEPDSAKCSRIIDRIPERFVLAEPSIIYQEVCGTIARRIGPKVAASTKEQLDRMIDDRLLSDCDKEFCLSAYGLCSEFRIYAIDALYVRTVLLNGSVFVSLDREDLLDKLKTESPNPLIGQIEAYHPSEFPY